jgi:peptide/nickel transport system permease protein
LAGRVSVSFFGRRFNRVDIPVIVGVTTVSAVAIVGGNLIADLVLPWVDPRIDVKK